MKRLGTCLILLTVVLAGCYHATIETGLAPGSQVIRQTFAASWIFGLVPPSTVDAAAQCPNGVAKVETQLSFLNGLVTILTFNIFTPMEIKVTCAASSADASPEILVPDATDEASVRAAFEEAARLAVEEDRPVYIGF